MAIGDFRPGVGFQVSIKAENTSKVRDARGRFIERDAGSLRAINLSAAATVQREVAVNIEEGIKREKVSTGRLVQATRDRRNIYGDEFGWGVGIPSFLDQSQAKYWRQIEEGYAGHVGREIRGVWGGSIAGWYHNSWGRVPLAGGPYTVMGQAGHDGQDKFRPIGGGRRYFYPSSRDRRVPIGTGIIEQEIEAMGAYDAAFHEVGRRYVELTKDAALEYLRTAFREVLDF